MNITKESAKFFHSMCTLSYSVGVDGNGEDIEQPHHPVLAALMNSHNIYYEKEFAQFCRQVADRLEEKNE